LSDELRDDLGPVVDFFGLPSKASVAKDFHVVRAIRATLSVDAAPFTLIFGGGTALARNGLRRELGRLGDKVTQALQDAGFLFDPTDQARLRSQNENRYTVWQLPYDSADGAGQGVGLRLTLRIGVDRLGANLAATLHDSLSHVSCNKTKVCLKLTAVSVSG
jgi:hypothetical protein